ncbi:MAG: peptide chain release factor 1 [Deltaproteobacteria bacterium]|nr:peptide chain release factor 1 [Deltaproteobacteria bacterium]MBW2070098.1 peptide chain release factor 1 [Deltaproteobacteria bacterium]
MLKGLEKLEDIERRYLELEKALSDPGILSNRQEYLSLTKEHANLQPCVNALRKYRSISQQIEENKELLADPDPDIRDLAREENRKLLEQLATVEVELRTLLIPSDPNDGKNVILEIRAGTGGDEAALFAADLFRMYAKYAELQGWKMEVLNSHPTGIGGFKEIVLLISGNRAYSRLKYESGVHRVQRVPTTESQGRIHTSAVTVAVLPEAEELEVNIEPNDLRIDVFRSSGPGGQSVNTTDSAVRITHLPTGLVVTCQDEKSQHKNKAKALKVLRARLLDMWAQEQHAKTAQDRRNQVGTGDRSERVRTYNFPQNRVTDHRINLTLYKLSEILQGELDNLINPLITYFQTESLGQMDYA